MTHEVRSGKGTWHGKSTVEGHSGQPEGTELTSSSIFMDMLMKKARQMEGGEMCCTSVFLSTFLPLWECYTGTHLLVTLSTMGFFLSSLLRGHPVAQTEALAGICIMSGVT